MEILASIKKEGDAFGLDYTVVNLVNATWPLLHITHQQVNNIKNIEHASVYSSALKTERM